MNASQAGIFLALTLVIAQPVRSEPLDDAAVQGPAQHYVMTLPEAPVEEIAQEVLGETLGLPVTVDERVQARMGFRIDGVYSPKELAREFGYRLWNVDVVLIDDPAEGLMVIPASGLADAVKDGGKVVSPLALGKTAPATPTMAAPRKQIVYGQDRWDLNGRGFILFGLMGWLAGVATCAGAVWLWARREGRALSDPTRLLLPTPDRLETSQLARQQARSTPTD